MVHVSTVVDIAGYQASVCRMGVRVAEDEVTNRRRE